MLVRENNILALLFQKSPTQQ